MTDVIVRAWRRWPRRCSKCRGRVLSKTKRAWQRCERCRRLWVDPQAIEAAVGAGLITR